MAQTDNELKTIIGHAKEYGFIFPGSEIYDGLSATYDYGQNGVLLKNKIKEYWWKSMVQLHDNIVGIDAAIFMHPKTWKASGHVDAFNDPMIDNKDSKKRYRADTLIEDALAKIENKVKKEITKAAKRFGDDFEEQQYKQTNPRVKGYLDKIAEFEERLKSTMESSDMEGLKQIILDLEIGCPVSGTKNWTEVRQFNLMFSTELGSVANDANTIYLRPETAQGIFVNYLNVQKSGRLKLPFGIAQIGKAFRNEIIARQFIFRMREFEQMEMQFFIPPGTEMEWYEKWKTQRMAWHKNLGIDPAKYRYHDHLNLAHYANAACDIEFDFPMGFKELEGIHSRTDFDLGSHQELSGKKLQYYDTEKGESYVPYVLETSIGVDRMFLAILSSAYTEEKLKDGSSRTVLKIPYALAPNQIAILPLLNKDGLPEVAYDILKSLKLDFACVYDAKDAIGKRYRRQDAIGTPVCITIDHDTLKDQCVTIRHRDTMEQERIAISALPTKLSSLVDMKELLKNIAV